MKRDQHRNVHRSIIYNSQDTEIDEAEVGTTLEFPCFFYDPEDVGNLIFGSFAFYKFSLYIWKFSVHILLKPSLKDFEHYLASMGNECNCTIVRTFFAYNYFCFIDYIKAFVWITTNCGKFLRDGDTKPPTCLLRNLYAGQEATFRTRHGITDSKIGKEYVKAVYCHSAYLTSLQITSCEMLGWINHKLNQDC